MKVLTATSSTQGQHAGDFDFTVEGELVYLGVVCASDAADPEGACGCGRSFSGLSSHRATTTALVRDLELSRDDLVTAVESGFDQAGWDTGQVEEVVDELLALAEPFHAGTVVERRLDDVRAR